MKITKIDYKTKTVTFDTEVPVEIEESIELDTEPLGDLLQDAVKKRETKANKRDSVQLSTSAGKLREGITVVGDGIDENGMFINPRRIK